MVKKRKVVVFKVFVVKCFVCVLKVINEKFECVFDMFVFGEGIVGEFGFGSVKVDGKKFIDVKCFCLNFNVFNVV